MSKIAVVVGHSETDPGAVNKNGRTEFEYNSELSSIVCDELIQLGHEPVIVWRDRAYREMPGKVNMLDVDFSIELHCNAFDTSATGSEVLFYRGSRFGMYLARTIQKSIVACLGLHDRGAKWREAGDRGGLMLQKTRAPHVILEPFFIDNPNDLQVGERLQHELGVAIAIACHGYSGHDHDQH